jgi:V8-like Glu-specific endopeptidase
MRYLKLGRLLLPIVVLAATAGTALAQSTDGNAGGGAAAGTSVTLAAGAALPAPSPKASNRDLFNDAPPALAELETVSKSADGTITSTPASAALAAAVSGAPPAQQLAGAAPAKPTPAAVVGVADASVYPYRAVGQVEATYGDTLYYCTGVLIGPSTVATLADCLYGFQGNPGWADKVMFYPAVNDTAPYEAVPWTSGHIMQGFLDASATATSSGTFPYGIGLVTLASPIGNQLGWFGFQTDINESYSAKAITYGTGPTLHNMSTTSCWVDVASMYRSYAFPDPCPASAYGTPFYIDDSAGKYLTGINVASYTDGGSAEARISTITYEWITEYRQ